MEGTLVRPQEPSQTTSQEELGFPHNRPLNSVGLYFPIRSICILGSQQSAAIGLVTDAGVPCKSREEKGLVLSTREGWGERLHLAFSGVLLSSILMEDRMR